MDNYTARSVEAIFGRDFQQYCLHNKILLKKDEQGAFVAPNSTVLTECFLILSSINSEVNKKLRKLQKNALCLKFSKLNNNNYAQILGSYEQYKSNEKKKKGFDKNGIDLCLANLEVQISLHSTSAILPTYTRVKQFLNPTKSGNQIYELIMEETIKELTIDEYKIVTPLISPLLEQFKKQDKKFQYLTALKQLTYKQELSKNTKYEYEITKRQIKSFFNLVLRKVVPLQIFGKIRNLKKISKALFNLLHTPRFTYFDLIPFIQTLDISNIIWLKDIESTQKKQFIIVKFVKWFFDEYLLKILYSCFHITTRSSTNNERLYFARFTWNQIQKDFIQKRKQSYALQPYAKCNKWNPPMGRYKLLPKQIGVRPVLMLEYETTEKNHLYTVFKFLKQLHITEYGLCSFQEKWRTIAKYKYTSGAKQLNFICCDVMDAFGSIKQEKLYEIIKSLCKNLPEELVLRHYAVRSRVFKDSIVSYTQYFSDRNLKLPFAPGTLYAYSDRSWKCQWIKKSWLLEKIAKYIFCQTVQLGKDTYIIGKGIVQGSMLSPILSDIYYSYVIHKEMSIFLKTGEIIKYMDDILFMTKDETSSKQFLRLTEIGIPQYNCYFNKLKTQCHLAYDKNRATNNVVYIGYKINCTTLEIEPKELNTDLRYIVSFYGKNISHPLNLLKMRLNNVVPLKLTKFVLDSTINSPRTRMKILKEKCLLQANRACILINELFKDVKEKAKAILKIIQTSNNKIARYVIKILAFQRKMSRSCIYKWNAKILSILWESYKIVFQMDQTLMHFIPLYM